MSDYSSDLTLAGILADTADAHTVERFRAQDLSISSKPDLSPVTDADSAVEDAIRDLLSIHRPDDAIAGEERGGAIPDTGRVWVIDPIDGTKNFLRGMPVWATLIALVQDGTPVVGMVSAPLLDRRWWAGRDEGAWLRERDTRRQLSVSRIGNVADSALSTTEIGSWTEHHSRDAYLRLTDHSWQSRAFGDFWQHCLVAEGAIDVAAEPIVNAWDVAAIQVLINEAGGRFTDLTDTERFDGGSALSTNGLLHTEVLELLNR